MVARFELTPIMCYMIVPFPSNTAKRTERLLNKTLAMIASWKINSFQGLWISKKKLYLSNFFDIRKATFTRVYGPLLP
jgi:hypothetical protein